jgi:hypothetical protein
MFFRVMLAMALIAGSWTMAQAEIKNVGMAVAAGPVTGKGSDMWTATDALGRRLPDYDEVGPPRPDRTVGMFYFLWLDQVGPEKGPFDNSKILAEHPEAINDKDHPAWGPMHAFHHWGESIFGHYLNTDPFVLRKHAEMLAAAGVDVVIFDVTNQLTYPESYRALCRVWSEARRDGVNTPKIAFLCPFWDPAKVVRELHDQFYGKGDHITLWFMWDGKPLIMADPEKVDPELRDFFTFRKPVPSYFTGPDGPDQWGWLEIFPQHEFHNSKGENEQMTVGVAQNAVDGRLGSLSEKGAHSRSFHGGKLDTRHDAVLHGFNFQEQWDHVLEADPLFVFVTGWNEWIAMRFDEFAGHREPVMFVDAFDQEGSRDIEPMKGGHGDNYYYQLVANIRRYKGVNPTPKAGEERTIDVLGDFSQWKGIKPMFKSFHKSGKRDYAQRDHPGWGAAGPYVNQTFRNDFNSTTVVRDKDNIYFMVNSTTGRFTQPEGPNWMSLYINTDRSPSGWEGYDFVVNRLPVNEEGLLLERSTGGWNWEPVARLPYQLISMRLMLAIPREALGVPAGTPLAIEFKWSDNVDCQGDISRFWTDGDVAPPGRFNYLYTE